MSVAASRVTVGDAATGLHTGDAGPSGTRLTVTNREATNSVALGPSGVTFAGGYELKAGETLQLALPAGDELYAVAGATLSARIDVLKTGA